MTTTLRPITQDDKQILANLTEKYEYEGSHIHGELADDFDERGLYCRYYDKIVSCTDERRWGYFIEVDGKLAGFALVNNYSEPGDPEYDFYFADFFVALKYRRYGVGKSAFFQVLDKHKGRWKTGRHPKNIPSANFLAKHIDEYTNGKFEFIEEYPMFTYNGGVHAGVYFFES